MHTLTSDKEKVFNEKISELRNWCLVHDIEFFSIASFSDSSNVSFCGSEKNLSVSLASVMSKNKTIQTVVKNGTIMYIADKIHNSK